MIDELRAIGRRVRHMVARGKVLLVDDTGPIQTMQVDLGPIDSNGQSLGIRDRLYHAKQFGFASNPPAGSDVIVLHVAGDRSNGVAIGTNHQGYRLKSLGGGETAIHDQWGNVVRLTAAGAQITHTARVTITAPSIVINGAVTVSGSIAATGAIISGGSIAATGAILSAGTVLAVP